MADLEVDLDLLESTAGHLGMLVHEFDRAAAIVDDADDAIGNNALRDEMHSFVDEWKHRRGKLVDSIVAVQKMVTESHRAYVEADNQLARDIQIATEEGRS